MNEDKIVIIGTGGTISADLDTHGTLAPQGQEAVADILDRSSDSPASDVAASDPPRPFRVEMKPLYSLLSEDMHPVDWVGLARAISDELNDLDDPPRGIVVTHGTDTLAFTSSALTFLLGRLPVPVVLTGALIPPGLPNSDAPKNLQDSLLVANSLDFGGVFVVMAAPGGKARQLYLGNQVASIYGHSLGFSTAEGQPSGTICDGQIQVPAHFKPRSARRSAVLSPGLVPLLERGTEGGGISDRVRIVKVYPGLQPKELLRGLDDQPPVEAILLDMYHSGTASTRQDPPEARASLEPAIAECRDRGVPVFGLYVPGGTLYASTRKLVNAGLIPLSRITLEAAYCKLCILLGRGEGGEALRRLMQEDLQGEFF